MQMVMTTWRRAGSNSPAQQLLRLSTALGWQLTAQPQSRETLRHVRWCRAEVLHPQPRLLRQPPRRQLRKLR